MLIKQLNESIFRLHSFQVFYLALFNSKLIYLHEFCSVGHVKQDIPRWTLAFWIILFFQSLDSIVAGLCVIALQCF